jgi:hypothetical protein
MDEKQECVKAAEHWEALAQEAADRSAWERDHGLDLAAPGQSVGDRQAATYRRCARTLRLEAETGLAHCMCHERPWRDCVSGGRGVRT